MKTINYLLAFIITLSINAVYGTHFDIRAYGGFGVLQLSSDKSSSLIDGVLHERTISGRPGVQLGMGLTFGSRFYVQPGIQYSFLSTQIVNSNKVTKQDYVDEAMIRSVSVPLKAGVRLINPEVENIFNVRLFGGFDGSHIMSVDHSKKSGRIDPIGKEDFSNILMSADFGMGLDIFIFYMDLGYQFGLTPVYSSGDRSKANSFYGNFGLRLGF